MKKARPIVVDGKNYTWKVGKGNIVIRDEDDKSQFFPTRLILGLSHDNWERLRWKNPGCEALAVTPKKIANFIRGLTKERTIAQRAEAECCGDKCCFDTDDSDPCGGKVHFVGESYYEEDGSVENIHLCEKHGGR